MKRIACMLVVMMAMSVGNVFANDVIEMTRAELQAKRKIFVSNVLQLSEEDSQRFWPFYREYRFERDKIDDRLFKMITGYATAYNAGQVSEEQARSMLDEFPKIEMDIIKLKRKYIKKFMEEFPPVLVARYFQIETKIDAAVRFRMAEDIPLIE